MNSGQLEYYNLEHPLDVVEFSLLKVVCHGGETEDLVDSLQSNPTKSNMADY